MLCSNDENASVACLNKGECKVEPGDCLVEVDPQYFRPTEVELLIGDPSKSKKVFTVERIPLSAVTVP